MAWYSTASCFIRARRAAVLTPPCRLIGCSLMPYPTTSQRTDRRLLSAEEGAARAKADTARAIAGATTSEADLGAEYMKIHQGNRLHRSDDLWFWWADNAGWTLDPGANASLAEVMRLGRDTFCRATKEGPLPALWAEGMRRRVDGTVGPLDSFARAAPPDVAARWAAKHRR